MAQALERDYPGQKFPCIFGALKDKAIDEMIPELQPHVSTWHVTRTPYPRFREIEDVSAELESFGGKVGTSAPMSKTFLNAVQMESTGPVLVTGSLYMIGETVNLLKDDFDGLEFFRGLEMSENEKH